VQTVVETQAFLRDAESLGMTEAERLEICNAIAANPTGGTVIPGTGGARKIRFKARNKGKSGGYRVISFYTGHQFPVFLLHAFAKNEKANLSPRECALFKEILGEITRHYTKQEGSK